MRSVKNYFARFEISTRSNSLPFLPVPPPLPGPPSPGPSSLGPAFPGPSLGPPWAILPGALHTICADAYFDAFWKREIGHTGDTSVCSLSSSTSHTTLMLVTSIIRVAWRPLLSKLPRQPASRMRTSSNVIVGCGPPSSSHSVAVSAIAEIHT